MGISTRTPMSSVSAPQTTPPDCSPTPMTRNSQSPNSSTPRVWRAVNLLDNIGAIQIRETSQRKYVAINPDRLQKDNLIHAIQQPEFYAPIQAFVNRLRVKP